MAVSSLKNIYKILQQLSQQAVGWQMHMCTVSLPMYIYIFSWLSWQLLVQSAREKKLNLLDPKATDNSAEMILSTQKNFEASLQTKLSSYKSRLSLSNN
jgi:hypothetical protein